jgi:hypothetical protein
MKGMVMNTISLSGLEVVVALHTQQDPRPEEWNAYIEQQVKIKKKAAGDVSRIRNFVVTDGGAPNAKQRAQLQSEAFGNESSKIAVISNALNSPLKRGIVTAIGWTNPSFKALPPDRWRDALQHVDLDGQIRPILLELERLQSQLAPVNSLALLVAQM